MYQKILPGIFHRASPKVRLACESLEKYAWQNRKIDGSWDMCLQLTQSGVPSTTIIVIAGAMSRLGFGCPVPILTQNDHLVSPTFQNYFSWKLSYHNAYFTEICPQRSYWQ